ncbi:AtpZ/AtpI family protein [Bradyrhizobium oligotrophicum]|uniref:AtpZ/AtpI family protein n=1 Tax=Bradyrhizobium TaxID=374 RepID=UPI0028F10D69|nr:MULTISPECIES: AtpZ/AtpI family protein [unclassified Bradyrhizobium]
MVGSKPNGDPTPDGLTKAVRDRRARWESWRSDGDSSVVRFVGQIGVLGWIIVAPTLIGLFVGRWIDRWLGTGIFWSAPLLLLGVAAGCWSAWRWMHQQ